MDLKKIRIPIKKKNSKIMDLRDYFAGQVLAGMGEYLMQNRDDLDSIAKTCYNIADSFMKQRMK